MKLTLEEQRLLAEFIGSCWHEWEVQEGFSQVHHCKKCGTYWPVYRDDGPIPLLDFSDWSVVGRILETLAKQRQFALQAWGRKGDEFWMEIENPDVDIKGSTPQEAICRAVLAWLGEDDNGR